MREKMPDKVRAEQAALEVTERVQLMLFSGGMELHK